MAIEEPIIVKKLNGGRFATVYEIVLGGKSYAAKIYKTVEIDSICKTLKIHKRLEIPAFLSPKQWLITPLYGQKDLYEYYADVDDLRSLPRSEVKHVLVEMAKALDYIHSHNVIHADVKLENFIVISDNPVRIQLVDFDSSEIIGDGYDRVLLDRHVGTDVYASPEMVYDKVLYKSSDIFSLGVVHMMFYMNTAGPCNRFAWSCPYDTLNRIRYVVPYKQFNIIEKCIEKFPELRVTAREYIELQKLI
jgi:serine/threonine protein kinase